MADTLPGRGAADLAGGVEELYREGQSDYWLEPLVLAGPDGRAIGCVEDGDTVVFCCRRGEREVQLTGAFVDPLWEHFPRREFRSLGFVTLTLYHERFRHLRVAFAPRMLADTLGEVVSRAGLRQLRVAESEKFAHVTYFFSGGNSGKFPGEEDVAVPSPKGIRVEQVPGLSLSAVVAQVLRGIGEGRDLLIANFANGDVIGHTASAGAKVRCAQLVDTALGRIVEAAAAAGYVVMVTADHGNLERMTGPGGVPDVGHTGNPVPFLLIDSKARAARSVRDGSLADVAPTVLAALGLSVPSAMTGRSIAPARCWKHPRRVLLLILDGWGIGASDDTNPIYLARTPVWDELNSRHPSATLAAAGRAVGLQEDKAGNSEAGHLNLGAGRVVLQDDVRLDQALQDGSFHGNQTLRRALRETHERGGRLQLIALLSEKSSHGTVRYPLALLRMAREEKLSEVFLHLILDGRSTEPGSAPAMLRELEGRIADIGVGRVVSTVGRGLALDRDGDYERTRRAYDALVFGAGRRRTAS